MDTRTQSLLARIADRVRRARKHEGLTAKVVAQRAGLSLRFYSSLESGEANIAVGRLAAVADALGVALETLVSGESPPVAIAMLGLRGAGKSTIGLRIADDIGIPFIELDQSVEAEAGLRLTEIFALHGEAYYRRLEASCLQAIVHTGKPCVLALSGAIVHNTDAFDLVRQHCTSIWLKAQPEKHMHRVIEQGDYRPMADRENAMADLRALLEDREPLYRQADITLDTSRSTPDHIATALRGTLADLGWNPTAT